MAGTGESSDAWRMSRRQFTRMLEACMALCGVSGCIRQPPEWSEPYVIQPENVVPGKPLFFATSMPLLGYAKGMLVETHMGRPTKIEGNVDHPASLGATDPFMQAEVLSLYDPDRARGMTQRGQIRSREQLVQAFVAALRTQQGKRGSGLRILMPPTTSPSIAAEKVRWRSLFPEASWHVHQPINDDATRRGALLAFGSPVALRYDLTDVRCIFALGSNFLYEDPGSLAYARAYAATRRDWRRMSRLYALESRSTITGSVADHRLGLSPAKRIEATLELARALGIALPQDDAAAKLSEPDRRWVQSAARDLTANRGDAVVIVGREESAEIHALGHAMNAALGAFGKRVVVMDPIMDEASEQGQSIADLVHALSAGDVEVLLSLGGNPSYEVPAALGFASALSKAKLSLHLSSHQDETALATEWHVAQSHFLESWGDLRAFDGTASIMQPAVVPIFEGVSDLELLELLRAGVVGQTPRGAYELVRSTWRERFGAADFESSWHKALKQGVIGGTAAPMKDVRLRREFLADAKAWSAVRVHAPENLPSVVFSIDPSVWDGRFANNPWLQELPKHLSKLTWENAVYVHPKTAERLGVAEGDVVRISHGDSSVEGGVWLLKTQPEDTLGLTFGYGRSAAGRFGSGLGYDAFRLRPSSTAWELMGVTVERTGRHARFACTQVAESQHERALARATEAKELVEDPEKVRAEMSKNAPKPEETLYPEFPYKGHAWGLMVDLSTCIGCSACVIACQAENNVATVGKREVERSREMHWLRIDRYFDEQDGAEEVHFQPMLCMHCEKAPCEIVCPVNATVHSPEGLNEQIYNRCVGTRYCSNNCPYKVRKFNFLRYSEMTPSRFALARNPDVTVRELGVMEKCTYCVQRINEAKHLAEIEQRPLRDGDIKTACQAACPVDALVFGDYHDENSRVAQLAKEARAYGVLAELNTRPRTRYLARIKNPNPELAPGEPKKEG